MPFRAFHRWQHRALSPPLDLLSISLPCSSIRFSRLCNTSGAVRTRIRAHLALTGSSRTNPLRLSPGLLKVQNATVGSQFNKASSEISAWAMLDFYGLRKDIQAAAERVEGVRAATGPKRLEADLGNLERKAAYSSLWDDPPKAQEILLALTDVKHKIKQVNKFKSQVEEAETIVKLTDCSSRAGGKGGQNVNKVETTVRIV